MNISLVYIFNRAFYRVFDFLRHWYADSLMKATHWAYGLLEYFDQFFALKITVSRWTEPIYQDYTIIGRLMGIIFRTLRIIIAVVFYFFLVIATAIAFLVWAAIPVYVVYQISVNL